MDRDIFRQLQDWKAQENRKPMLLQGARQVGKTWLMKEFGRREYKHTAYLSFTDNPRAAEIFNDGYRVESLIDSIALLSDCVVTPGETLIILDEIQECERALQALKFFREHAPEYHIIAAGSLLGVAVRHRKMSFPVGQVDLLTLRPLSFLEYLSATGDERLRKTIESHNQPTLNIAHDRLVKRLKEYFFVGGMPEVVQTYIKSRNLNEARRIQHQIIQGYENDFAKYTDGKNVPRIHAVWRGIPAQLARDNKKFVYKHLGEGARAREYENAVEWLIICGLLHKVSRISKPAMPLSAYESMSAFKLYMLDCGLLGALSALDASGIIDGNHIFEEFKGSLTEQYVLQELMSHNDVRPAYWEAEGGTAEVDFIIQHRGNIIPIEVKASVNLKARSLASYRKRYEPELAVRTSLAPLEYNNGLLNIPLYAVSQLAQLAKEAHT